jgi:hypothetical protein
MPHSSVQPEGLLPASATSARTGQVRLAVGIVQGLVLYLLYFAAKSDRWPATEHFLFAPMVLLFLIAPILLISSLGHLARRQTVIWVTVATLIIAALGFYDVWRGDAYVIPEASAGDMSRVRFPSPLLFVFLVSGFFIAHSLRLSAAQDHRRIARYSTHFESAWKLIIQLVFSGAFTAVLWGALWLGASLFMLVKLSFLKELLQQPWCAIPVTTFAFACAMHITDVRPEIVRGIRSLLLVLLSWILPVTTLIVAGFLLSLPLTGLQPLWATKSATAMLLCAAALLVVLINTAFQNGEISRSIARVIRFFVKPAALSLLPIVAIAIYSLGLRVHEYGWTSDRIIAAACLLVATSYACGYAWAVFNSSWMRTVAPTNVATAYLVILVLLALFSPVADPARISVNNQVARLQAGTIAAGDFDYEYLRFEGARYGHDALARLKNETAGAEAATIREKARLALDLRQRHRRQAPIASASDIAANIAFQPGNERLPASFASQNWSNYERIWELPMCLTQPGKRCDAFAIDMTGDGKNEILLLPVGTPMNGVVFVEDEHGAWTIYGTLPPELTACESFRQKMIAGEFQAKPALAKDLDIGGQRFEVQRHQANRPAKCPPG